MDLNCLPLIFTPFQKHSIQLLHMKRNSSFHRCNSLQQPPAHFTADRAAGISRGIPLPKLHVGPQKESQNRTEDCFPPQIQSSCARSCSCTLSPGDKLGEKACRVHVSGERRCSPAERCCPENAQHPSGGCDASFLAATTGSPSDCPADGNSPAHPAQHHTALHSPAHCAQPHKPSHSPAPPLRPSPSAVSPAPFCTS